MKAVVLKIKLYLCFCYKVNFVNKLCSLVNKSNLVHNFSCMFVSILYMFRAIMCPSLGDITVSMRHLLFVTQENKRLTL
jgi:hypothetical protein